MYASRYFLFFALQVDELGAFLQRQPPVQPMPLHISPALLDADDLKNNNNFEGGVYDSMGRRISGVALEPGLLEEGSTRTLNLNSASIVSGVSKMGFMTGGKYSFSLSHTHPMQPLTQPLTYDDTP